VYRITGDQQEEGTTVVSFFLFEVMLFGGAGDVLGVRLFAFFCGFLHLSGGAFKLSL
jgi:hypothetical protein